MTDVHAADFLDFLEERHNDKGVVLNLRRNLVFLSYLDSFKLNDKTGVNIILGLEYKLMMIKSKLTPFGTFRLNCPHNLQIVTILAFRRVILSWRVHAHSHEIVVVLIVVGDDQLVDRKVYTEELLVFCHVVQGEQVGGVVVGEGHRLEEVILCLLWGVA